MWVVSMQGWPVDSSPVVPLLLVAAIIGVAVPLSFRLDHFRGVVDELSLTGREIGAVA